MRGLAAIDFSRLGSKFSGFSLIELVVVIVLMSIVSLAGVEIIGYTARGYEKMLGRQALGNSARLAVDRIAREVRQGLPGSARVTGTCIEFIPITAAGNYLTLPVEASATSFQSIPLNPGQTTASGRIAVYPIAGNVYDTAVGVVSDAATLGVPDVNNEVAVNLSAAHQFPNHSPNKRFFLIADPVSFCVDGDNLFRYQDYGLSATQVDASGLPGSLPDRVLLANKVGTSTTPFAVFDASLQRNSMVAINLSFTDAGESVHMLHEVQLRNVP